MSVQPLGFAMISFEVADAMLPFARVSLTMDPLQQWWLAATKIQAVWRKWRQQQQVLKSLPPLVPTSTIVKIQAVWRGHQARKIFWSIVKDMAYGKMPPFTMLTGDLYRKTLDRQRAKYNAANNKVIDLISSDDDDILLEDSTVRLKPRRLSKPPLVRAPEVGSVPSLVQAPVQVDGTKQISDETKQISTSSLDVPQNPAPEQSQSVQIKALKASFADIAMECKDLCVESDLLNADITREVRYHHRYDTLTAAQKDHVNDVMSGFGLPMFITLSDIRNSPNPKALRHAMDMVDLAVDLARSRNEHMSRMRVPQTQRRRVVSCNRLFRNGPPPYTGPGAIKPNTFRKPLGPSPLKLKPSSGGVKWSTFEENWQNQPLKQRARPSYKKSSQF